MKFFKIIKNNAPGNHFTVYMESGEHKEHYVCDYIAEDTPEAQAANELGLTLRSRLLRSKGKYTMIEGNIYNPTRLLSIIVSLKAYDVERFTGNEYRDGHALLKIEADGCTNRYLIYSEKTLDGLLKDLRKMKIQK